MKPVIAIIGRTNVGKSTLFNALTRTRNALVADMPGLTRDRLFGEARIGGREVLLVDTGGLVDADDTAISELIARQSLQAAREADVILLIMDARAGLMAADRDIAEHIRTLGKPLVLAANKSEGLETAQACADFHSLGLGEPVALSAAHRQGLSALSEALEKLLPVPDPETAAPENAGIVVAVVGRPNVGKSTLINRVLGEERVLTFDQPGTTRDSIAVRFTRLGKPFTFIDTAGIRRRHRVQEAVEKFSIIKALQSIDQSQVALVVLDARIGVTDQDSTLLGLVLESGRALVIAINKWDGLAPDEREQVRKLVDRKLRFVDYAAIHYISALHGSGVGDLFQAIEQAHKSAFVQVSTPQMTRLLEQAIEAHQPPMVRGRRIKLRYAHLGDHNPPTVVIHGSQTASLPGSYQSYLENYFRKALRLVGTPIRLVLKQGENPYAGRRRPRH